MVEVELTSRRLGTSQLLWVRSRGFTFIELMVVLFVVGLIVSLVAINIDDDVDSLVKVEARRFAALARLAADESILQGKPIGIDLESSGKGYQFLIFTNRKWVQTVTPEELRQRNLQHEIRIKLLQSEASLTKIINLDELEQEGGQKSSSESKDFTPPEIILTPVGIINSFHFLFYLKNVGYSVKSNKDSGISIEPFNVDK